MSYKRKHVFYPGEKLPKGDFVTVDAKNDPVFRRRMMWLVVHHRGRTKRYRTSIWRIQQCISAAKNKYPRAALSMNRKLMRSTLRRQPWGRKVLEFFPIDEHGNDAKDPLP